MHEYEINIELFGEEYPAIILFEWDKDEWEGRPLIGSIVIRRSVKEFYNAAGEYKLRVNILSLEILPMMDDNQLCALADKITADALCRAEENRTETRLLTKEYEYETACY